MLRRTADVSFKLPHLLSFRHLCSQKTCSTLQARQYCASRSSKRQSPLSSTGISTARRWQMLDRRIGSARAPRVPATAQALMQNLLGR